MNGSAVPLARAVRGPVTLITIGVLFALNNFTAFGIERTWPAVLIVFGLLSLLRKAEPVYAPPPPPPVRPAPPPRPVYNPPPVYNAPPSGEQASVGRGGFGATAPPRPAPSAPPADAPPVEGGQP